MLSLSVLSTLVVTSFASNHFLQEGPTLLIVDDGFNTSAFLEPAFTPDYTHDPIFMQALRFIQQLLNDELLKQAAYEQRLVEQYMMRLEQEEAAAREFADFITLLQHNPTLVEKLFDQHPEFFGHFQNRRSGEQPEEQQQKFFGAYPEVKRAVYNPAFPTDTEDASGSALAATRDETDALVDVQIAKGGCPVTEKPKKLNYLSALGLDNTATTTDVKKAYRNIARIIHPDKNVTKDEKYDKAFKALSAIYTYLSNDANLAAYKNL